jgi:hypothetical protein
MKYLLLLFLVIIIACGQEGISPNLNNDILNKCTEKECSLSSNELNTNCEIKQIIKPCGKKLVEKIEIFGVSMTIFCRQ